MNRTRIILLALLLSALWLAACGGAEPAGDEPPEDQAPPAPTATQPPAEEPQATPTDEPPPAAPAADAWQSQNPPLPAEPMGVTIQTADGRILIGGYYPAKVNPAPIVVMMHWAGGDKYDWWELAPWLQNRPNEFTPGEWPGTGVPGPWLDRTWFPPILEAASFGVLVFDFNGFGESPFGSAPDSLLQDAVAAIRFAATLEGADPARILALGGSIGADGAVDGCVLFNREPPDGAACLGSLSLSPGNYLGAPFTYAEGALELAGDDRIVYCLAAENDAESGAVCAEPEHANYFPFIYAGDDHAMFLIQPEMRPVSPSGAPTTLELVLGWLEQATGLPVLP